MIGELKGSIIMVNSQVKSRERVNKYGEVYTNKAEINSMLNLVDGKSKEINSTFLEPACGNGNFLIAIFERKLDTIISLYSDDSYLFEVYSTLAISSIYGIDIQNDNVEESRRRLLKYFKNTYICNFDKEPNQNSLKAFNFILKRNIVCGDSLTYKFSNGKALVFPEWRLKEDGSFVRRGFLLKKVANPEIRDKYRRKTTYNWLKLENDNKKGDGSIERKRKAS